MNLALLNSETKLFDGDTLIPGKNLIEESIPALLPVSKPIRKAITSKEDKA